ncbi:polar amino acid transport system substrate-binding protein [Roseateles sp. YR242]|uniref:substrate-binding periplasmic protein n=1 Tax=Roseateles sp. YR242 TaxID=1855305 RepID=UPI0008C2C754|nr:transporter substrate-binding domain-containing protein [Roseateles sp. YR242]SEK95891.1 polar amino acid transport system substrate-binding protein [Roseateles sp. YR242]
MSLRSLAATSVIGFGAVVAASMPLAMVVPLVALAPAWMTSAHAQSGSPSAPGAAASPVPAGSTAACTQLVASGNPQYPPYLWRPSEEDNRLVGANAELMQWLAHEIGIPIDTRYVGPWGRVQEEMRAGRIDLIAGAFFTLPRTEYMDYFHPAFRETRSVVWARTASPVNFKRWSDLVAHQGVTVINNSFGVEFDQYARQSLKITQVASIDQAIQMLQRGRADYLIYEDSPAEAYVARSGGEAIRPLMPAVAHEGLFLTLAHRSRCNTPELRGKLARAVYKLSQERVMNRFIEQGIQLWKRQAP